MAEGVGTDVGDIFAMGYAVEVVPQQLPAIAPQDGVTAVVYSTLDASRMELSINNLFTITDENGYPFSR